jgi:tungstate transport system substrate-binding protein
MRCLSFLFFTLLLIFIVPNIAVAKTLTMATTSSTQASGLLDILLPEFKNDCEISVKVIAKGTGAAIRDGIDGNVDIIFVHAQSREEKFIADGYGTKRYPVMHNDFIIIGPPDDPAGVMGMNNAVKALEKIADKGVLFVSRGDDSGTHTKELSLWAESGVELKKTTKMIIKKGKEKTISFLQPDGQEWYRSIGQGMGKILTYADEKHAYTISDRGTYIKYKHGRKIPIDLVILVEGGKSLNNPYGIIPINPKIHAHVNFDLAKKFANWLTSQKAQKLIGNYRLMGKQLFHPDAL